jgi:hypothetical protein
MEILRRELTRNSGMALEGRPSFDFIEKKRLGTFYLHKLDSRSLKKDSRYFRLLG